MKQKLFNFEMNKLLLPFLLVFFLFTGIISGLAYERYSSREQCLKDSFVEPSSDLSPEEIDNITKALNSESNETEETIQTENKSADNIDGNEQQAKGLYVGSRNSNKFYSVECRFSKLIKDENKIFYESVEAGESAGRKYVECK